MDQTSWLDLSGDCDSLPTSPSPLPSPPSSPIKLTRSKSIIERSGSRASQYSISPNASRSDDQLCGRAGLPPWDRTVDVIYHKYKHREAKPDRDKKFPEKVRLSILQNLVASHEPLGSNPVSLNRFCWNQDCWEPSDFTPLREVLTTFHSYCGVSFDFYASLFVTILSEYTFHVTFSAFIAPRLNPLATTWLNKYGPFMKSLIIEIDLSRLSLGPGPGAAQLLPCVGHLQNLLFGFSTSQLERAPEAPLETLILACRRFYGQREDISDTSTGASDSKETDRTSSDNPHNQPPTIDRTSKAYSSEIFDRSTRVTTPDPQNSIEQPKFDPNDTKSENPDSDPDSDDYSYDDISVFIESSGSSSPTNSSSDSSSNPDTSLAPAPSIQEEKQPFYCPEKHLSICNHLLRLRNNVTSLRMAGFSEAYSHAFIATMFPKAKSLPLENYSYRVAPSTLWPRLRGQKSWIDAGRGTLILDDHEVIPDPCIFPEGPIQLPPPIIYKPGITSLPWCCEPTHRPRNNTASSDSSWPSQRSLESNEAANTSKSSRSSYEKSRMQKLLDKYKEKSRRRPRPISAP
ncbi:hypothetical protein TARUN_2934 [Trichoderma arundinaceum]|uniref:Uncharacterized protein n=1 Tax=Trichoderma arundinaceum TaxID=490622 RepID=A0A395NTL0_TRIAR|nr:hypothetical protein TARUN_2934 [Trichoderma arundinaceum]